MTADRAAEAPDPPGRVTVAELAGELAVPVEAVLRVLADLGTPASDDTTPLPDEAVFAVWPRLATPRRSAPAPDARNNSAAPHPGVVEAFATTLVERWSLRHREATTIARRWLGQRIDLRTATRFWSAGLGPYDHQLAVEWLRHGLTPEDLLRQVGGRSAGRRLRGGEPLASISTALRAAGGA